ncbi:MAG: SMP-30/gluconolactonase/LRE family protein [Myxococcales bacterium]|nr:SMP-30/gluconolactonase/LRE family protein [Myxococcales bacterium]MCB9749246.1 SMP-30/gluconolactonase/LRE family protein [Myxococcales bacterium]
MRARRVIRGIIVLFAASTVIAGLTLMAGAGQFRRIDPHFEGRCTPIEGAVGVEDLVVTPGGRAALLASDDRRARDAASRGGIYIYSLDDGVAPRLLSGSAPASFHPHGLDLVVTPDGRGTLYVVNHELPRGAGHSIEVFDWRATPEPTLTHRATIRDPLLVSPNDVAGVDHSRFYVTNDHGAASPRAQTLEDYTRRARARVVYHDGEETRVAADGLRYANGIALRPDGAALFVSSTTDRRLHVFARDRETGALSRRADVALSTGPDNIDVEPDGTLWIAGHPKLLSFVVHARAPGRRSPSQVLRLRPVPDEPLEFAVEEVYLDDGSELSGASVAARRGRRLLIGGVFEPEFLDCTMDRARAGPTVVETAMLAR